MRAAVVLMLLAALCAAGVVVRGSAVNDGLVFAGVTLLFASLCRLWWMCSGRVR